MYSVGFVYFYLLFVLYAFYSCCRILFEMPLLANKEPWNSLDNDDNFTSTTTLQRRQLYNDDNFTTTTLQQRQLYNDDNFTTTTLQQRQLYNDDNFTTTTLQRRQLYNDDNFTKQCFSLEQHRLRTMHLRSCRRAAAAICTRPSLPRWNSLPSVKSSLQCATDIIINLIVLFDCWAPKRLARPSRRERT